jgi:hypothetical protein
MDQINVAKIEKSSIDVMGIMGKFITPNSKFRVRYFSTYANKNDANHRELLKELKPMRERINTNEIHDISALLQRDLDDLRVSTSLIPYLKNTQRLEPDSSHIAFFPAILAVLIPENFIKKGREGEKLSYPYFVNNPSAEEGKMTVNRFDYIKDVGSDDDDFYWRLNLYPNSRLGQLKIDPAKTSLIVLDGQHRSNAFRVLTDSFFQFQKDNTYDCFYDKTDVLPEYDSDLPVTIIWFERIDQDKKEEILPTVISRDLFIAVNDNARQISSGRKILLNDKAPTNVLTKLVYSEIASKYSFDNTKNELSLLHMGFDINTDLREHNSHKFTITTPEIIEYLMDWVYFGHRRYSRIINIDSLSKIYKVPGEYKRFEKAHFDELLPELSGLVEITTNDYGEQNKIFKADIDQELITRTFKKRGFPIFQHLFTKIDFVRKHFIATTEIHRKVEEDAKGGNTWLDIAWNQVFNGGEGLYYALKSLPKESSRGAKLRGACDEIEKDFINLRATYFTKLPEDSVDDHVRKVNRVFSAFTSKAFQVGLFMAFLDFHKASSFDDDEVEEALNLYVNTINSKLTPEKAIIFFQEFPSLMFGSHGVDPKYWPSYHKLLLKIVEGDEIKFFDVNDESRKSSPEYFLMLSHLLEKCKEYASEPLDKSFKETTLADYPTEWIDTVVSKQKIFLEEKFSKIGLKLYEMDYLKFLKQDLRSFISSPIEEDLEEERE